MVSRKYGLLDVSICTSVLEGLVVGLIGQGVRVKGSGGTRARQSRATLVRTQGRDRSLESGRLELSEADSIVEWKE